MESAEESINPASIETVLKLCTLRDLRGDKSLNCYTVPLQAMEHFSTFLHKRSTYDNWGLKDVKRAIKDLEKSIGGNSRNTNM